MASERLERQRLEAVIGGHVLDQLGCPEAAHSVTVRHLWAGHYRVNVFVGEAAAFAQIAHSYFVSADDEGRILESVPAIRKRY
jgi:hypothetical protein